jgi:hypothetical protein
VYSPAIKPLPSRLLPLFRSISLRTFAISCSPGESQLSHQHPLLR